MDGSEPSALPLGYSSIKNKKTMTAKLHSLIQMAGLTRFELVNDGVKVRCLTAWLMAYIKDGGGEWIRTTELGESGFTVHRV